MTNDYGIEINSEPLLVTIPEEEYKFLCWCRNKMQTLHPVFVKDYEIAEKLKRKRTGQNV